MVAFTGQPQITGAQSNAGTTSNDADAAIINGLANPRQETVDNTNAFTITNVSPSWLWERNVAWRFQDAGSPPTAQITLTIPASPARGLFAVRNDTSQAIEVTNPNQTVAKPVIQPGRGAVLFFGGTNVLLVSSGVDTFLGLTDTPASFAGQALKALRVNSGATALEFADFPVGGGSGSLDALPVTLSPTHRGAMIVKDTDETSDFTTFGAISFDSAIYDTDNFYDNGTNAYRLFVPAGVTKVRVMAGIRMNNVTAGNWLYIEINSSIAGNDGLPRTREEPGSAVTYDANLSSAVVAVTEGDWFEVRLQVTGDPSTTIEQNFTYLAIEVAETTEAVPNLRTVAVSTRPRWRGAQVKKAADESSADYTTLTAVPFDTVVIDTDNIFDDANDQLVVPAGVTKVRLHASIRATGVATTAWSFAFINSNIAGKPGQATLRNDPETDFHDMNLSTGIINVKQGDWFQLMFRVESGIGITITADETWFEMEIVETVGSVDAPTAYIAVPPEHKGALLEIGVAQSTASATPEDMVWTAVTEDTKFDPGDGGPPQRFWLGQDQTFVDGDVDTGNDNVNIVGHGFETGEGPFTLSNSGGGLPTGLSPNTLYWAIRNSADDLGFATSRANALAGTHVSITAAGGGGTHTIDTEEYLVVPANAARIDIGVQIDWASDDTGLRTVIIQKRDASNNSVDFDGKPLLSQQAQGSSPDPIHSARGIAVSEGDRFAVLVQQNSGGPLDVEATVQTWFYIAVAEEARATTYPGVTVIPPHMGALVRMTGDDTTVDASAGYLIPFDDEVYDTHGFHGNVTNPERLTIPSGLGIKKVRVKAGIRMTNVDTTDWTFSSIGYSGTLTQGMPQLRLNPEATFHEHSLASAVIDVADGDYFHVFIDSGADANIDIQSEVTWFAIEVAELDTAVNPPEPVEWFINGTPAASELIFQKIATRRFSLVDDFAGSQAYAVTAPSSAVTFDVDKNGTKIGEITFAASSNTATFTTTGAGEEVFDVGDRLSIDSPANLFSIADTAVSLFAWRS